MHVSELGTPTTIVGAGLVTLDLLVSNLIESAFWRRAGGTCANVLAILSFLGFRSVPIARLGTEEASDLLISDLESVGVDCHYIDRDFGAATPRIVEFIPSHPRRRHRFGFKCPLCNRRLPKRSEPILDIAVKAIEAIGHVELFFFDRPGTTILSLARKARERGAVIMFEPDTFKSNDHFTAALEVSDIVKYSRRRTRQSIDTWLINKANISPKLVIETADGVGLRFMLSSGESHSQPWVQQEAYVIDNIIDQAGAGDWCSAGFIAKLVSKEPNTRWCEEAVVQALAFGQALAAASIGFEGPKGYLETFSLISIHEAAHTTLRTGRVPEWVHKDCKRQHKSGNYYKNNATCALCLRPSAGPDISATTNSNEGTTT